VEYSVAKARRKKSATTPLRPADFPVPKRLSQEKVSEICGALGISDRHGAELKSYLDKLVSDVHRWMSEEKAANRKGDRDRIFKIRKRITAAQHELNGLRIDGRLAVRSSSELLAHILSSDWLRYRFPDDAPRMREPGVEVYSNYLFIRSRAFDMLQALLRDLESALASALASLKLDPRTSGGRPTLKYRHHVILDLAEIWHRIRETPVGTPGSDFAIFCESIFEGMEWPTDGLDSAIPHAVKSWRNR
jgi:hypothetical protein